MYGEVVLLSGRIFLVLPYTALEHTRFGAETQLRLASVVLFNVPLSMAEA